MIQEPEKWGSGGIIGLGFGGYGQTLFLCQGTSELGVVVWISRPFLGLLRSGFPFNLLEASDRKVRCRDGHPAWTTHETLPVWMSWKESIANEIFILLSGWSVVRLLKKLPFHKFVPLDLAHGPWREDIKSSRKRFFFFRWYWGCFLICAMLHNSMFCFAKEGYLLGYCENKSVLPYVIFFWECSTLLIKSNQYKEYHGCNPDLHHER
jgi:hypothetical protein